MKKMIVVVITVTVLSIIAFPFLLKMWQTPTNSNKYDLDYVLKNLPQSEYKESKNGITIQGLFFPKDTYRILYEDNVNKTATIQFRNLDTSDADYIVPLKKMDIQDIKTNEKGELISMIYKGRTYDQTNTNFITNTKDYILVQMLQPPPGLRLKYDFRLSFSELIAILQILTIIIAVSLYFWESNKEKVIVKREIYQKLELASIDIFKFEIENDEKLWCLYSDDADFPRANTSHRWAVQEYVCQVMNLFEMIIEFKLRDIIDDQVFLSWVQWFWDMSCAAHIKEVWNDVRMNYTAPLRKAIDTGIRVADNFKDENEAGYKEYLGKIAEQFGYSDKKIAKFLSKEE